MVEIVIDVFKFLIEVLHLLTDTCSERGPQKARKGKIQCCLHTFLIYILACNKHMHIAHRCNDTSIS